MEDDVWPRMKSICTETTKSENITPPFESHEDTKWKSTLLGERERRCRMITLAVTSRLASSDDGIARQDHLTGPSEKPEVNHPFPDVPYAKGIQRCIVGVEPPQLEITNTYKSCSLFPLYTSFRLREQKPC